jgi:hypothetical protein
VAHLVGAGAVHRAPAGAAGQHERAVNIEKNEVHYAAEAEHEEASSDHTCGGVALARATSRRAQAAPKAAAAAGIVRAHADIKGEGITGTADFVETQQGTARSSPSP